MHLSKKNNRKKRFIIVAIALVALSIGAYIVYDRYVSNRNNSDTNSSINFGPPTAEESAAGDRQKDEIINNPQDGQNPAQIAAVSITDATYYEEDGVVEVGAQITNIAEDGGDCVFTLTKAGSAAITRKTKGINAGRSTDCGRVEIPRNELSAGTWLVKVSYSSTISGESQSNLEVF